MVKFDDKKILKVLMPGAPGLQEIRDIPTDILKRLDITCVDRVVSRINLELPVNSCNFIQMNVFDFLERNNDKFDLVLNRWFLHHVSENNKNIICQKCYQLLNDDGFMIIIDWFIDDWETPEELFKSITKYYEYRVKYLPHQLKKLSTKGRDTVTFWWHKLHDDEDWSGGKHPSREKMGKYLKNAGFRNIEIHHVANEAIIDDPYLWGDVLLYAEKR